MVARFLTMRFDCRVKLHALIIVCMVAAGCASPRLVGKFDGQTYTSVEGAFSVANPLTGKGARVTGDDKVGVSFGNDFGDRVSFYGYRFSPGSKAAVALKTDGPQKVLDNYFARFFGNPERHFHPDVQGGTMSCFYNKPPLTGAAAFVRNNRIYLAEISIPKKVDFFTRGEPADAARKRNEQYEADALKLIQTLNVNEHG